MDSGMMSQFVHTVPERVALGTMFNTDINIPDCLAIMDRLISCEVRIIVLDMFI